MGNLCCGSDKKKKNEKFRQEMEFEKPTKKVEDEQIQSTGPSSPQAEKKVEKAEAKEQLPSFMSNKYGAEFHKFVDTHAMFKQDRAEMVINDHIKLDYFLKFYKASMMWNKILYQDIKLTMLKERREMMANNQDDAYKQQCAKMTATDEKILQDVMDVLLDRIKMSNESFQKSLMKHMGDPNSIPQIQKARSDNEEGNFDKEIFPESLTGVFDTDSSRRCKAMGETEAINLQKELHKMSLDHMRELKKLPLDKLQPELGIIAQVLADKVHEQTQLEAEDIDAANERLNLEGNATYQLMVSEYMQVVQGLKLGQ